jgi:type IV fimbrial biogenesis protein FimT
VEIETMRNIKGYTLTEIMVVIAIIAIVTAIAVPNMLGWRGASRLRGAVDNLKGDLQRAKMMAVRESAFIAVDFDVNETEYTVCVDNGATPGDCETDERIITRRQLPAGVRIDLGLTDLTAGTDDNTRFNDRGLPTLLGTIVVVNSDGDQRQVSLNRLGRLRVN